MGRIFFSYPPHPYILLFFVFMALQPADLAPSIILKCNNFPFGQ